MYEDIFWEVLAVKCMKCGKDMKQFGVFCANCQDGMESYPVKPGTPIQLPPQTTLAVTRRKARRRSLKPEEQIARLRTSLRLLTLALIVALAALALSVLMYFHLLEQQTPSTPPAAAVVEFECFT